MAFNLYINNLYHGSYFENRHGKLIPGLAAKQVFSEDDLVEIKTALVSGVWSAQTSKGLVEIR